MSDRRRSAALLLGICSMGLGALPGPPMIARPLEQANESGWMPSLAPVGHFGGGSYAVATAPGRVYAGEGPVLTIYEDREDSDLHLIGRSTVLPGMIRGIQARGDLLVLALVETVPAPVGLSIREPWPRGGLVLVDVGQAETPRLLAYLPDLAQIAADLGWTDGEAIRDAGLGIAALQMELAPPWLFVATEAGLLSFDVRDPSRPRVVGRYAPGNGPVWSMAHRPPLLYVNGASGPRVLDVRDPAAPLEVGCLRGFREAPATPDRATQRAATASPPLRTLRPTRSPIPTRTPVRPKAGESALGLSGASKVRGSMDGRSSAPNPAGLQQADCIDFTIEDGLLAAGTNRLVLSWIGEVLIFDLANPREPELVDVSATGSRLVDMEMDGSWLYGLAGDATLPVIDAGQYQAFDLPLAQLDMPGQGAQLAIAGDRAFVATGEGGLRAVSLDHPQVPREFDAHIGAPHPMQVEIQDGLAYVVDAVNGLQVFDLEQPAKPEKLGAYRMPEARRLALDGDRAILQDRTGKLRLLDISRRGQPRELGPVELAEDPELVQALLAFDGRFLLSTVRDEREEFGDEFSQRIEAYEMGPPGTARGLWQLDVGDIGGAHGLLVDDQRLFAVGDLGLAIYDLDPTEAPTRRSQLQIGGSLGSVANLAVAGERAFLTRRQDKDLVIIDIGRPEAPRILETLDAGGDRHHALMAEPGRLYHVSLRHDGLDGFIERLGTRILRLSPEGSPEHATFRPGPGFGGSELFNRSGRIEMMTPVLARWGEHLYLADPRSGIHVYREFEGPRLYFPALAPARDGSGAESVAQQRDDHS